MWDPDPPGVVREGARGSYTTLRSVDKRDGNRWFRCTEVGESVRLRSAVTHFPDPPLSRLDPFVTDPSVFLFNLGPEAVTLRHTGTRSVAQKHSELKQ